MSEDSEIQKVMGFSGFGGKKLNMHIVRVAHPASESVVCVVILVST